MISEQISSDKMPSRKEKGDQTMSLSGLIGTFISCIVVKDVVAYICNPSVLFGSR